MRRYLILRVLGAVPLVLGIATLAFLILHLAPGDASSLLIAPGMRAETVQRLVEHFGLDRPLHVQYLRWLAALVRGDLGQSILLGRPVAAVIGSALPNTLLLSGLALVVSFALGIAIGVVQAVRHRKLADRVLSVVTLAFYGMPAFWLSLLLMLLFARGAYEWGWPVRLPASGMRADVSLEGWAGFVDLVRHLVLPVTALSLILAAGIARYVRASVLEALEQDYVRTARAKGLSESTVVLRHALRNGLLPVITLVGLYLPVLFTGAVLVEEVFAWPGMGQVLVRHTLAQDYPVVLAVTLLFSGMVVLGNLVADLLYAAADPRVRRG